MGSTSAGTVRYGLLGLVPNPRAAAGILTVQLYSCQSSTRSSTMNAHVATSVLYVLLDSSYEYRYGTIRYARSSTMNSHVARNGAQERALQSALAVGERRPSPILDRIDRARVEVQSWHSAGTRHATVATELPHS